MRLFIRLPSENLMFAPTEASRREPNSRLAFSQVCKSEVKGIRHAYTKPSRSKPTAGPSALSSQAYDTSEQRKKELSYWLHHYNWHRPHAGMKGNYRSDGQACM
jgi:hypothetical protein